MIARNPRITFENALPHWAADHTFAQITNAGSTSLPYVETYLNRVMARATQRIADPGLKADIALFCAQEGNHYEGMLARLPLTANAAYCEGFESLGIIHAEFFFEQVDDLLAGADARLVRLWKWHLAEEFEHRSVCYDVYRALGGGYFGRIRGFLWALRHLGRYGKGVADHLLSVDRQAMDAARRAASLALEKRYRARFLRFAWPRLLHVLSPRYDPRTRRAPRGALEFLAQIRPAA